jgi:hypothetical protein
MAFDFSALFWIFLAIMVLQHIIRGAMVCLAASPGDPRN